MTSTGVAWAIAAAVAIYLAMIGLYQLLGRPGALALPIAMLAAVVYLTLRDAWRRHRG
jgi:hypothetical protein